MTDSLAHRGPDGRGTWYGAEGRVALGHRRLAIVDLSEAGGQPMHLRPDQLTESPSRRVADPVMSLTFNGEIYNHRELRAELGKRGHSFVSECDSEVILHAYAAWGGDCVHRLDGIFAFAIWDGETLFAARDPAGVKPLYFTIQSNGLAFASEPRALLPMMERAPAMDMLAMDDFLAYGITAAERSAFAGISRLLPGHTLSAGLHGEPTIRRYWTLPEQPSITDRSEAIPAISATMRRAVEKQLMADVPVGVFLSGGLDSSVVSKLAAEASEEPPLNFALGFKNPGADERPFAEIAAKTIGAPLHAAELTPQRAGETLERLYDILDEPFGYGSMVPMIAISEIVRDAGYKVMLSGDGADELFAGYNHYDALVRQYGTFLRRLYGRLRGRPHPLDSYMPHGARMNAERRGRLAGPALREAMREREPRWRERAFFDTERDLVDAARRYDMHTYLPDEILTKVDRSTMAAGVEARVPFLDRDLMELAFSIDPALHYENGERKSLLKECATQLGLGPVVTARKRGFGLPTAIWSAHMERLLAEQGEQYLTDGVLVQSGVLAPDAMREALTGAPVKNRFQLLLLEQWARRWIA